MHQRLVFSHAHMLCKLLCCLWKNSHVYVCAVVGSFECTHTLFLNWALVWRDYTRTGTHTCPYLSMTSFGHLFTFAIAEVVSDQKIAGWGWRLNSLVLVVLKIVAGMLCADECVMWFICEALTIIWLMCARVVCLYLQDTYLHWSARYLSTLPIIVRHTNIRQSWVNWWMFEMSSANRDGGLKKVVLVNLNALILHCKS